MNAIELLKKDHETVKELLSKLEDTTERAVQTRKKSPTAHREAETAKAHRG